MGFPCIKGAWCNSKLKIKAIENARKTLKGNVIEYIGIAYDEPLRIEKHRYKNNVFMPLVEIGWDEDYCGLWCKYNDLLSPIYEDSSRGGCWFCHNQGVDQLRKLRAKYPDRWKLLLKWDNDSPITFKADGHTVHDFDKRFEMEDKGIILKDEPFKWEYLKKPPNRQLKLDLGEENE